MDHGRKVVFDAGILILLLQEGASAPVNPQTKEPVTRPKDRVEYLKECFSDENVKILIPTPAFSECLVHAGEGLVPFSQRAAIEAAVATYQAKRTRRRQDDAEKAAWQRVKIDIQTCINLRRT